MRKKQFLLAAFALVLLNTVKLRAQTNFEVPAGIEFTVKEDYAKHEANVIAASKWLEENDLDKELQKRKEVSAFVMKWIMGSPTVNVSLTPQLMKVYGKNSNLLVIYMGSYTRFYLENKSTATSPAATKAGLISMMNVYKKGIEITKNKEMEKVIKAADDNKLDDYITDKFK